MSDSNSSSSNTTNYVDSRKVLGQGANFADNGASLTVNNTTTDAGALRLAGGVLDAGINSINVNNAKAFNFGSDALSGGLDFAKDSNTKAFNFGSEAIAANTGLVSGIYKFADKQTSKDLSFGTDLFSGALSFAQNANTQAHNDQQNSLATAENAMGAALKYGASQTAGALDSLNTSADLVKNAYADAKGRGAMTDYLLMAAIGVAGLVAWSALRK
jgi:hypothetical protein